MSLTVEGNKKKGCFFLFEKQKKGVFFCLKKKMFFVCFLFISFSFSYTSSSSSSSLSPSSCDDSILNRDWIVESHLAISHFCNVPAVSIDTLSLDQFEQHFRFEQPLVVRDSANRQSRMLTYLQRQTLLQSHGNNMVVLSSSNTFSYAKKETTLKDYIEQHISQPVRVENYANETFYMFGDTNIADWQSIFDTYQLPPFVDEQQVEPALSFGMGADGR